MKRLETQSGGQNMYTGFEARLSLHASQPYTLRTNILRDEVYLLSLLIFEASLIIHFSQMFLSLSIPSLITSCPLISYYTLAKRRVVDRSH